MRNPGIVKFVGQTSFAKGKWIGIELTESMGKNDGACHDDSCRNQHQQNHPLITTTVANVLAIKTIVANTATIAMVLLWA